MRRLTADAPTDAQVDQILLDSTRSGRLSRDNTEKLLSYIRELRTRADRSDHYTTSEGLGR